MCNGGVVPCHAPANLLVDRTFQHNYSDVGPFALKHSNQLAFNPRRFGDRDKPSILRINEESLVKFNLSRRAWLTAFLAVGATLGLAVWFGQPFAAGKPDAAYRTAKFDRGNIVSAVASSGTINPISIVIVGSQLSGQVVEIMSDYNDIVKADQILARLNADQLRAKADAARADLAQSRALSQVQDASLEKNRA